MMPEYVQCERLYGPEIRRVARQHRSIGTSSGSWWCPFCDNSQAEGRMDCAKCGAVQVALPTFTLPANVQFAPDDVESDTVIAGGVVRKEAVEGIATTPSPAAAQVAGEVAPAPGRTPRVRRTPPPKSRANGRKR